VLLNGPDVGPFIAAMAQALLHMPKLEYLYFTIGAGTLFLGSGQGDENGQFSLEYSTAGARPEMRYGLYARDVEDMSERLPEEIVEVLREKMGKSGTVTVED